MTDTGIVILCHGSRGPKAIEEIPESMDMITTETGSLLPDGMKVTWAALQFNQPDLAEAVTALAGDGVKRIVISPYFLFSGNHITEDIPAEIETLKTRYPDICFIMTKPLGMESTFPSYIAQRIISALPDIAPTSRPTQVKVSPIETESMQIIDGLLPELPGISDAERSVVKRIVHALGDPDVARLVHFHRTAIENGLKALREGQSVYTDVKMVRAGISRAMLDHFGGSVRCILDEAKSQATTGTAKTRSAAAFLSMGETLNGSIVAIGNAPTALFALIELVRNGIRPALTVGMPVGFVQAAESKEALEHWDIPYITLSGRRGGSPAAAATVNALLRLALEKVA